MMSKTVPKPKSQTEAQDKNQEILNAIPYENGFHFYTALGQYTGITANSLSEFAQKLQVVPVESISFHFQREDYQKWIRNTLKDQELARRLDELRKWPTWSSDENLRKEILKTVQKRITELRPNP
jgi:hypothetical protein